MHPFSPAGRLGALRRMGQERLDLLVVGGGIIGCGLAREAALAGLGVGLVEQEDFGYGTSSRSSKLVHSGLRYLAYGDLRMVIESLREREILKQIAPHLVRPVEFLFPFYAGRARWPFQLAFQLMDLMGAGGHRRLSSDEVRQRAPVLGAPFDGGVGYLEYTTDDARLTLENALSAALHGAVVANHAKVTQWLQAAGKVVGAVVSDGLNGDEHAVRARVVVNATGPWAEGLARHRGKRLLLSKGIHLLFPATRLPLTGAVVLRSPDGREGFAVRRWESVYVGTTDVAHVGAPDRPLADEQSVADLLALTDASFPDCGLTLADVAATWAGLRPLIAEPGRAPRDTSRHDQIWVSPDGLITVAGGKLTTYRQVARRVMGRVWGALGHRSPPGERSAEVPLPGAGSTDLTRLDRDTAERLGWLYGAHAAELLRYGEEDPRWMEPLAPDVPALRGEARLAVEQSMALTLLDFMDRRSGLLLFCHRGRAAAAEEAAAIMAGLLGWTDEERRRQVAAYQRADRAHRL